MDEWMDVNRDKPQIHVMKTVKAHMAFFCVFKVLFHARDAESKRRSDYFYKKERKKKTETKKRRKSCAHNTCLVTSKVHGNASIESLWFRNMLTCSSCKVHLQHLKVEKNHSRLFLLS